MGRPQNTSEAILGRVQMGGPDDCWPWIGSVTRSGYGQVRWKEQPYRAHRAVFEIWHGRPIQEGCILLHTCDNRRCCNPAHLREGTCAENEADKHEKRRGVYGSDHWTNQHPEKVARGKRHGRHTQPERTARGERHGSRTRPGRLPRGEQNPHAKLTVAAVREIRRLVDTKASSQLALARRFGCGTSTIFKIVHRQTWTSVPDD